MSHLVGRASTSARARKFVCGASLALTLAFLLAPSPASAILITFDTGTDGNSIGTFYDATLGVTFGSSWTFYDDDGAGGTGGGYPEQSDPLSAYGPASTGTTITFDHPVSSFSFYYDVALFPEKFNAWEDGLDTGSCVLCDVTLAINTDGTPAGATGPNFYSSGPLATPIRSVRFFQGDLTIDDFSFTPVPEPSTLALVGVGFAGVGWFARRRFRRK